MVEIFKTIKSLLAKGYATRDEKTKLAADIAKLKADEQAILGDEAAKVNDLPETGSDEGAEDLEEVKEGIKALFSRESAAIKADVKEFLKEQKELMSKGVGIYHPAVQEKRKLMSDRLREMTKALLTGDEARMKEMTTDATGSPYAGYTVDSELSAEIRHLMTEYGVARREMTSLPLTKGSYKANNLATDITTYWVDQAATIRSSQIVLGQEELTLEKLGVIVTLTRELLEDGEIDLFSFIGSRVAEAFAKAEDEAFFKGDGTSTYGGFTGLLNAADVNEVVMTGTTFASIDYDDLVDMQDETPSGALANAKYYMHRTIRSYIRKLKDENGQYIYSPATSNGPQTIDSYPLVLVEAMPSKDDTAVDTSFVLFGDLRKACIQGYKSSGLEAMRFNSGVVRNVADGADVNLITTDREAIRFTERTGYVRVIPAAVTKLTTASASA